MHDAAIIGVVRRAIRFRWTSGQLPDDHEIDLPETYPTGV